jgi:alpha-tubulin suppressor-like RCC1 family protein
VWLNFNNKSKEEQAANIDVVTRNEYDGPLGTNQAPTPVDLVPGKVVWIECGPSWNAVQLEDGTLWTWGLGVSGQLARSKSM